MTRLNAAISGFGVLVLALSWHLSAFGQAKAQSPSQALLNLYQATQQLISDPAGEYEKGGSPDFPYPSAMQAQWDASMAANGASLSNEDRDLYSQCATDLNAAIADVEIGYRIKVSQPSDAAQKSGQTRMDEAPPLVAKCSAAVKLAQGGVSSAPTAPQQGGVDSSGANGSAVPGTEAEAAQPGSIDWTPALSPLQTYLATEWQRVVNANPNWAGDEAGNTLTLKLQPGQLPQVLSATGSRSYVFNNIMQSSKVPVTSFPNGSKLNSVSIAPTFTVKSLPGSARTRLKYYERGGIFKSYLTGQ